MNWKATLVHSNDDIEEATCDTREGAQEFLALSEAARGCEPGIFDKGGFHATSPAGEIEQWGHDYHYGIIERVAP